MPRKIRQRSPIKRKGDGPNPHATKKGPGRKPLKGPGPRKRWLAKGDFMKAMGSPDDTDRKKWHLSDFAVLERSRANKRRKAK